ncbi:MAG: hypothetical protein N0E44_18885 [Candidatus Thiodiazotropha lotti]|nr:hypothetical protein [Candidatus Thiodiazotropha lotti]MCW4221951.1 hypothetical protein [Candidatus Thiodiazotropha lotti]
MGWLKLAFGAVKGFFTGQSLTIYLIILISAFATGVYFGKSITDAGWQRDYTEAMEEQAKRINKFQVLLATAQNELATSKAERKVEYREKIKYITADAPDCELESDRLHSLVCAVRPSDCQR